MRICIIAFSNIAYLPYVSRYTDFLNERNIPFDVYYWKREDFEKDLPVNYISFDLPSKLQKSKISKIRDFIKFRSFIIKKVGKNYDGVIVLSTLPAILLKKFLKEFYMYKYIVDIRDPSYEKYPFFNRYLQNVFKHAYKIVLSSRGFKDFLPQGFEYIYIHNIQKSTTISEKFTHTSDSSREVIKISFLGFLRHSKVNIKLLDIIGNDERFELSYYGFLENKEALEIKKFVEEKEYRNVKFKGKYNNDERDKIFSETDIIHNLYNNDNTKYSLGNKLYDGALFLKPQLVSKGSYMGEVVQKFELGLSLDCEEEYSADEIYDWYKKFDNDKFIRNSRDFLKFVEEDERYFYEMLSKFTDNDREGS